MNLFNVKGFRFPREVILVCIRWYVAYPLSYRHLENNAAREYYKNSLKFTVLDRIRHLSGSVILGKDIQDMGSPRQISRCFKDLVEMGELVKIGYGIYAKASKSTYLNRPIIQGSFGQVCKEALTRLGVAWEVGSAAKAYNAGQSTQVPVRPVVCLKSRYRGHLKYGANKLVVEKGINAK